MFTCPRCNAQLQNGTRFCNNCGLQFDQSGQPSPPAGQVPPGQPFQGGQFQPAQPPKKKRNPFLIGCLGLFALLVVLGVIGNLANGGKGSGSGAGSSTSSPSTSSPSDTASSSTSDTPAAPAAISVSASELSAAYNANEVSADDKYKDKLLAVSGTVDSIGKDITDTPYITLSASGDLLGVQCMFDDQYKGSLAQLQKGQHVTIHGTCKGKTLNVLLADCTPN